MEASGKAQLKGYDNNIMSYPSKQRRMEWTINKGAQK